MYLVATFEQSPELEMALRTGITLKKPTRQMSEVVLMIQCPDEQVEIIQQLLWDHHALAIGTVKIPAKVGSSA